jgi:hypothetical protein
MMMIWTEKMGDDFYIIISRCNNFNDHKSGNLKGKDGDIVIKCKPMGNFDEYDTIVLINKINNRLQSIINKSKYC